MYAFGIPEGYFSERANRANAEQARATMIENAVWPLLELLREDLNAQWGGRWWAEDERVGFKDFRPRNIETELKEFETVKPVLTVDELRALRKYDPIGDYRGAMLLTEIEKQMALPGTAASQQAEAAVSAMEQAPAGAPTPAPLDETTPPEGMGDAPALDAEVGSDAVDVKAKTYPLVFISRDGKPEQWPGRDAKGTDLARWERKALKALKDGKGAGVRFAPDALTDDEASAIRDALDDATTPADVRSAFKAVLIDEVWDEATTLARQAMAGED
jgi:hypothetical protein